jgi:hypothetical protein
MAIDQVARRIKADLRRGGRRYDCVKSAIMVKRCQDASLMLGAVSDDYMVYINDNSVMNPFGITAEMMRTIRSATKGASDDKDKAYRLFEWFEGNIRYEDSEGYLKGTEVFRQKHGVCGEMAFLYVTMARSVSLKANYVSVMKDCEGKQVKHACAGVEMGRITLVDPAYHKFDVRHQKYKIRADNEIMGLFEVWRNG